MTMLIGTNQAQKPTTIDPSDLTTHGVILGRTGSGKTGATVVTIEEAVLSGASVIVLDPKGDLTNLALAFPELAAKDYAPWTEKGKDPAKIVERARKELGHLAPNIRKWKDAATVTIYAPGKTQGGGRAVNLLPSFGPPTSRTSEQAIRDRASGVISSILSAIGHGADPLTDPANVFLTDAMVDAWKSGKSLGMEKWASLLSDPPAKYQTVDGLPLDDFFPKRKRMKIARAIVGFRRQATKWLDGDDLTIDNFVGNGKPKVSVFTMRHLDEGERQFFSSMLLSAIVDYMFKAPASDSLRLLVVLDEARGYLPPYPLNPPTKKPICTLLAQGRAQGIGMLIGTQNPNDMDYKALTNVGTWFLGRLRKRDCARDLNAELAARSVDTMELANIKPQHFLILKRNGDHALTKIRWAYSYLRGPLSGEELLNLDDYEVLPDLFEVLEEKTEQKVFYDSGDVVIYCTLTDADSRPSPIVVEFSTDGGRSWQMCCLRNQRKFYPSSSEGRRHKLTWNSVKDLGRKRVCALVRFRMNGRTTKSSTFNIDNSKIGFLSSLLR